MGFHQPFSFCYLLLVIKSELLSKKVNVSESNLDKKGKKNSHRDSHAMYVCVRNLVVSTLELEVIMGGIFHYLATD